MSPVPARIVRWRWSLKESPCECYWTHPVLSLLLGLEVPLTIVWGQNDFLLPHTFGKLIHKLRPNTKLYLLPNASHNPAHSAPDEFCGVLSAVLCGTPLPPAVESVTFVAPLPERGIRRSTSIGHTGVFGPAFSGRRSRGDLAAALHTAAATANSGDAPVTALAASPSHRQQHHAAHQQGTPSSVYEESSIGMCQGCGEEVHLFGNLWKCGCGSWTYAAAPSAELTRTIVLAMEAFLEELHVLGSFNAKTSAHVKLIALAAAK